jgi:hypothetical protein
MLHSSDMIGKHKLSMLCQNLNLEVYSVSFRTSSIGLVQTIHFFGIKGSIHARGKKAEFFCHEVHYFEIRKLASVANFSSTSAW